MAVTSIWPITGNPGNVIDYAANPQKTTEGGLSELAALHAIDNVVEYTADQIKTEKCHYVSGINCIPSDAKTVLCAQKRSSAKRVVAPAIMVISLSKPVKWMQIPLIKSALILLRNFVKT
jgi:hypothetical protein